MRPRRRFPSLSGKTSIRTKVINFVAGSMAYERFHPFQGRPLFGLDYTKDGKTLEVIVFPSLSGKTSIRTSENSSIYAGRRRSVSIPFREDLYSDLTHGPFLGCGDSVRFHPFQGRPLFGHLPTARSLAVGTQSFPSLSGKTSIRTHNCGQGTGRKRNLFPSLSGKTSIRTIVEAVVEGYYPRRVSIPFREDLYSDKRRKRLGCIRSNQRFHPFQGRPLFGQGEKRASLFFRAESFHPFQGRPLFGPNKVTDGRGIVEAVVSIPFREDLYSDHLGFSLRRGGSRTCFHPFQGRPLFGHSDGTKIVYLSQNKSFHPFQGRPLFGQCKSSKSKTAKTAMFPSLSGKTSIRTKLPDIRVPVGPVTGFHPFQGRPLFGQTTLFVGRGQNGKGFPSLSGKTSIRTRSGSAHRSIRQLSFPSLSGKTSIRTPILDVPPELWVV